MQLSILIPTFNCDCSTLVRDLRRKCEAWGGTFEIIVGDDASSNPQPLAQMLQALKDLEQTMDSGLQMSQVRVLTSETNLGRARNRNQLADAAQGEWLLFVDCDAAVPADFSLTSYMAATKDAAVVCGGLRHPDQNPCKEASLRYRYEREADRHRAARFRQKDPHAQLSTFNLMVRRDVFQSIRFDEACIDYGYEDTLFGVELERRGIAIVHVDCPLIHMGLEPNAVFLEKTETALRTLRRLEGRMGERSTLGRYARRLQRWHVAGLYRATYRLLRPLWRHNLLSRRPSLTVFSAYKLGYYLEIKNLEFRH